MSAPSRISLIAGLALVASVACGQLAKADEGTATSPFEGRIESEEQYRAALVGKKVDLGNGYAVSHADGRITGKVGNKRLTGKWAWKGKYFCRIVRLDGEKMPFDCQVQIISGDELTVIRKKGKGKRVTYKIIGPE
ncbi:MAG: hypothetical protein OXK73_11970 [Rhodospirillaceae bacterium]|nr:hypothetical protein [Rhodospirillaceae bacterium]MDE0538912.1 hypothetical protein [Rhodospirillales bacterium]